MDADLEAELGRAWSCLEAGAAPGRSRFSMVQVASIGLDGAPKARTVVIRSADRARRTLAFNTDRRSPKVAEMTAEPRVTLIGYDMEAGLQVRVEGLAAVHLDGPVKNAAWSVARPRSRICYRTGFAPGDTLSAPAAGDPTPEAREPDDLDWGIDVFARIEIEATRVDWLDLASSGHRRAVFDWADGWRARWVAP